jgi:ABC-2 type transport system ATP-binding protein
MHAIEVVGLRVEYRRAFGRPAVAVDGLSFHVEAGEIVGFVGVNGAGKTTTIKALMGFQPITSGRASIFGYAAGTVEAKRDLGFLPETALYSPYLTPSETLRLYGELHGLSGKELTSRIGAVLDTVGINDKAECLNRSLSKGMLQRVGIAQALLGGPKLLILDEVSSGLDPIGRRDLRSVLSGQREMGVTVFFSSHSLSEVEMLCDRVIIVDRGRLIAEMRAEEMKASSGSLEDFFVKLIEVTHSDNPEVTAA